LRKNIPLGFWGFGVLGFWGFGVLGFVINSGMPLFNPED